MTDEIIKRQVGDRTIEIGGIGPDIDLDEEEVYLEDDTRLTEELAEQIGKEMAEEFERRRGRPSVTSGNVRTPNLTIRVPAKLRATLEKIATRQGRRVSDVGRDALAEYAARHNRVATRVAKASTKKTVTKAAPRKAVAKKATARETSAS